MALTVHQFRCLSDNYGFLVRDEASGKVATIDTPDAGAILAELAKLGWSLDLILNTHWHPDHAAWQRDAQDGHRRDDRRARRSHAHRAPRQGGPRR